MARRLAAALACLALAAVAVPAGAAEFDLPEADVEVLVRPDGSVSVTERITYDFDGSFSGGYRDVPLRAGETITDVSVAEGGAVYRQGGCTELGCSSPPGTFGVRDLGGRARIVWHHDAADERRTFEVQYRLTGLAKVYDDIVDVYLQVWGSEWSVGLDRLTADVAIPAGAEDGEVYVWGHPASVDGRTSLGPGGIQPSLEASDIPPGQFVELRVAFPRRLLSSTSGATAVAGPGLELVREDEARIAASGEERVQSLRRLIMWGVLIAVGPAIIGVIAIYLLYGREPEVGYDREYEQEPPDDLTPAEVAGLIDQGHVDERAMTATIFDLVRRGALDARPVQVQRATFLGLRQEQISDLEISLGTGRPPLAPFEQEVLGIVENVLDDGPLPLHEFRSVIREDARANASAYGRFVESIPRALEQGGLLDRSGSTVIGRIVLAAVVLGLVMAFVMTRLSGSVAISGLAVFAIGFGVVINAVAFLLLTRPRRLRVRRTRKGAEAAARWNAFRRYLTDFSRLHEAPSIALDLWDRYLVYAVGFGVAEEILESARLHAPPEVAEGSRLLWYGNHGYTGGSTENAFAGLQSALAGAFRASGSSGGGGGFSGGGSSGGGGGGGGGGAW